MELRTDNAAEVGTHAFERAGLGKAPFKVIGSFEMKFQACPGAPVQPGGSCDFCGQGIMYAVAIRSADGRKFKVGCDCVGKTGDAGLLRAYKQHPDTRKLNRDKAAARDEVVKAEWQRLMADPDAVAKLSAVKVPNWNGIGTRPWLDAAENSWRHSGASGRARNLRAAKKLLKQ